MLGIEGEPIMDGLVEGVLSTFKNRVKAFMEVMVGRVDVLVWVKGSSMLMVSFQFIRVE